MRLVVRILGFSLATSVAIGCTTPQAIIEADHIFENVNIVPLNEDIILANKAIAVRSCEIVAILDQLSAGDIVATTVAELQSDERLVYLPKSTRDEYVNPETNEYRAGFPKVYCQTATNSSKLRPDGTNQFVTTKSAIMASVFLRVGRDD